MRNHPDAPSRSARGDLRDFLATGVMGVEFDPRGGMRNVLLVSPGSGRYQAAPCYIQDPDQEDGHECFDMDLCECYGKTCGDIEHDGNCWQGEQQTDILKGRRMTCYVSTGAHWPPRGRQCRLVQDREPIAWRIRPTEPDGDTLFNVSVTLVDAGCSANMFTNCTAKTELSQCCFHRFGGVPSGRCCDEPRNPPCPEGSVYNPGPTGSHQDFNRIHLSFGTLQEPNPPRMPMPDDATDSLRATIDAKNAALERIRLRRFAVGPTIGELVAFDGLDNVTIPQGGRSGNGSLGLYQRKWRKPDGWTCDQMLTVNPFPRADGPLVMDMPNCLLKHSRCPVSARLFLVDVNYRAHFVIVPIRASDRTNLQMYLPSVRVHIEGAFATSAKLDGTCTLRRPWLPPPDDVLTLEIDEGQSCAGVVRYVRGRTAEGVDRGIVDEIMYVDDRERRFSPPEKVHWWGYLGQTSVPRWHLTEAVDTRGEDICKVVRVQLRNMGNFGGRDFLNVGGWPYSADTSPDDPNSVYEGAVKFEFSQS